MEVLRTIALYTDGKEMPFLVIGGHAVNAYGLSRQTGDLDLLVQRRQKAKWLELLEKLDLKKAQDDDRFTRFTPVQLAAWPIDLMYVDDETFQKLFDDSVEVEFGVTRSRVVSAPHLAVMKIHALKYFQEHRFGKDYGDLLGLLRSGTTALSDQELRDLCERYADLDLYDRIRKDLGTSWR